MEKCLGKFSIWGMYEIHQKTWLTIVEELESLRHFLLGSPRPEELKDYIGFFYEDSSEDNFTYNLSGNAEELAKVITAFQTWIIEKNKKYDYITILGI